MKKYLTVGTRDIYYDLFRIANSDVADSFKPKGGLWMTEFDASLKFYNSWVDFMLMHPNVLFYKNNEYPFVQDCAMVTLDEECNIFCLSDRVGYEFLIKSFKGDNGEFSFEKMSQVYDGLYVDVSKIFRDNDVDMLPLLDSYGVNSLVLFNGRCISYYQRGVVEIEPFDYECRVNYEIPFYEIKCDEVKRKVRCK